MTNDCGDSIADNALETCSLHTSSSTPSLHRGRSGKPCFSIAMNQVETLLISSAGDVLACHCRRAPHHPLPRRQPQPSCQDEVTIACCEPDDLSLPAQDAALCMWTSPERTGGLMGGNPAEVASPLGRSHHHHNQHTHTPPLHPRSTTSSPSLSARAHEAFRSPPINNVVQDEDSIVPIRSFDYSHFQEGGNDMVPPEYLQRNKARRSTTPVQARNPPASAESVRFFHGIPTFVPAFSSVRMSHVSAHPDGAHVLCISEAGLLYSYGLNPYGQLGIGITSSTYMAVPTIVTPLVEHGGKAIACAAGVDHSLVVVRTEERRLYKSQSHPSLLDKTNQPLVHHQVYGFGRNDYMKLGLVSPKVKDEIVPLPRRVALHAQIPADSLVGGIVAVAASVEHSAALVQRPSGAVEVYTWGNATHGALGLPKPLSGLDSPESPVQVVPVPSFCAALSSSPQKTATFLRKGEEPTQISLGPYTTHVVTNKGRLFSCGKSNSGLLGAGPNVTECSAPHEVELPSPVVSIRAGRDHAVATTSNGRAWVWGTAAYCGTPTDNKDGILWVPKPLELPDVLEAAAGYDNTVLVQRNGSVWSCGKASGRLGLGETTSSPESHKPLQENGDYVLEPRRLWGGLTLWRVGVKQPPPKPLLQRGLTLS
jgi:alpha-tubulin suppressor-like RCC1 family protein